MIATAPFAYTVPQLARAWGVSSRHVYDLCASGELGHLRIRSLIRIRQADREAYEARSWQAPGAPIAIPVAAAATVVPMLPISSGKNAFQQGRKTAARSRDG